MNQKIRTYSELMKLETFKERYDYLKLGGAIGKETFGFDRYLNQTFYNSPAWKSVRDRVIIRDESCDLAHPDHPIYCRLLIHHMNPITRRDILDRTDLLMNPEYLICTTYTTHNAIHYGTDELFAATFAERKEGDTCPWKKAF